MKGIALVTGRRFGVHVSMIEPGSAEHPHLRYQTSDIARGIIGRKYVDPTGDPSSR